MPELDPRIVRVGFEINGQLRQYEGLSIIASGTKYANPNSDECTLKIANLSKELRDYLATETSPFNANKSPKIMVLEAGRVSYGYSEIYRGNIQTVSISQPPDTWLEVQALTGSEKATEVVSVTKPAKISLQKIAEEVAKGLGASLTFQASDKQLANYIFAGGNLSQIKLLADAGDIDAYLDGNTLVVKDKNVPLTGKVRVLNKDTGLIGIPQITEFGVRATMLLDNQTTIGGALDITSDIYPAVNGKYAIYKMSFDVSSRDTPFYYHAEAVRIP